MIAALYASHSTGTANCFSTQGTRFGWKAIEDMLKREVETMKKSELVRVPGLKENYVYRDSWTRLNVKPAKIMQVFIHVHTCIMGSYMLIQCGLCIYMYIHCIFVFTVVILLHMQQEHVLAELEEYARQTPVPHHSDSVLRTVAFLKACNSLFERGILGKHVFIKTMESPIITSMDEGYCFFGKWLDEHLAKGTLYVHLHVVYVHLCIVHKPSLSTPLLVIILLLHSSQVTQLLRLQDALFYPGRLGIYCV